MTTVQHAIYDAIRVLGSAAFAFPVRKTAEATLGGEINIVQFYDTLDQMEETGWVQHSVEPGGPERGNRPKRFYWIRREATR